MRYLITGHTGFKGAWLSLMLAARGDSVVGIALDPRPGSLFARARVADVLDGDVRLDIRDRDELAAAVVSASPDVVIHMAAQPLVRESYRDPRTTMTTNVVGTLNTLEAVAAAPSVRAHLVVTTDKVYRNVGRVEGYREDEPLGGADPYSASKAMADLLVQSWRASFDGPPTAIARAGNVIGGGDDSSERLMPDLMAAFAAGSTAVLRNPEAVRPWQHVADCLAGYLTLTDALLAGDGAGIGEWNFGPGPAGFVTVAEVADQAARAWGGHVGWRHEPVTDFHEAPLLALDVEKAKHELGWTERLDVAAGVDWTVEWHRAVEAGEDPRRLTEDQLARFDTLGVAG